MTQSQVVDEPLRLALELVKNYNLYQLFFYTYKDGREEDMFKLIDLS